MNVKLANNASSSVRGIIYQFYIALHRCFEMGSGQKLYIEQYGDVTVSASQQLEVKHYHDKLTDNHPNFWKTLYNWMHDGFDVDQYVSLVLLTTQEIGVTSLLQTWNTSDVDGRLNILNKIQEAAAGTSATSEYSGYILDQSRAQKCKKVVSKFIIAHGSPDIDNIYGQLKDKHANHVLNSKCEDYLNALLGYVISKKSDSGWEITNNEFTEKIRELTAQYCKDTRQFPTKYRKTDSQEIQEIQSRNDQLFVSKIVEINYNSVIPKAIEDYLYASHTVLKDFRDYQVSPDRYEEFSENVLDQVRPKLSIAKRNATDIIKDSQNAYDDLMGTDSPSFRGFENPPISFKNGVIHMNFDDPKNDLKWRLE